MMGTRLVKRDEADVCGENEKLKNCDKIADCNALDDSDDLKGHADDEKRMMTMVPATMTTTTRMAVTVAMTVTMAVTMTMATIMTVIMMLCE